MITRIVKLEFHPESVDRFLNYFDEIKETVNTYPGCLGMKLYRDISEPNIVMTYSHWETPEALNRYRDSAVFGTIWSNIKPWFNGRPQAWSMTAHFDGFKALRDD